MYRKGKKKMILLFLIILLAVLLVVLTGCDNKESKEKTSVKRTEQEQAIFDYITEHTLTLSTLSCNLVKISPLLK